ncbi:DUF5667 domain-containing protein [Candidatus Kaiserbacteria bacterium]|nr:DUF5667 domain-containing protein [Candidatus Kaiserbacteria bacterium]
MIEEHTKDLNDSGKSSLTHNERAHMRNSLRAYMSEHPVRAPLRLRILDALSGYGSTGRSFGALASSALALALVVGIGSSYAAENALPGSPLYAIKIHVNEPLEGRLASTQSEKADWNTRLMTRRLEEAEQLAAEGKLTPVARAQIQSQIALTATDFNVHVAAMEDSDNAGDAANAVQAQSNLEATLSGHAQVLSVLADKEGAESVVPLLASVIARNAEVSSKRSSAERIITHSDTKHAEAAALSTRKNAGNALEKVKESIIAAAKTDATSSLVARMSVATAEQTIAAGDQKMKDGDFGEAFATFQSAARTADSARVHIDADIRLSIDTTVGTTSATSTAASTSVATSSDSESD